MRSSPASAVPAETYRHLFALALLGPAWFCIGKLAQRAGLPLITGYVVGGILCGPSGLNLFRGGSQHGLLAIDHACLAIIAVTAGAELQFENIRRIHKQVIAITLGVFLGTWLCVFSMTRLLVPLIPFLAALKHGQADSIASLAATLMAARSPASAIAVVKETGGKGPYCSLILAVVVMKDVLVFVCFAVNLEFTRVMQLSAAEGGMRLARVLQPFVSLGASLLAGALSGVAMSAFVHWRPAWRSPSQLSHRLPRALLDRLKTAVIAGSAGCIFWLADRLDAEPLLACVTAGIVTANRRGSEPGKEDVAEHMSRLMTGVNTIFFGLAGASLRVGSLLATIWVAFMIWAARLAGIYGGSWVGAWLGGTPAEMRRRVWQGMITQAGVAMGLAKTVATRFPTWGPEFATLMVATILLNLFVGPPLFRGAIVAAGEAGAKERGLLDGDGTGASARPGEVPRSPRVMAKDELGEKPSAAEKLNWNGLAVSRSTPMH